MSIHLGDELPDAEPGSSPLTTADYYRRPERDTAPYRHDNVERTTQVAADVLATTSAARWLDEVLTASVTRLARQDLGRPVQLPGTGPMTLADWVTTRVLSVAAHGLDVALTLGRTPWTTQPALNAVRPILVSLLGTEPPAGLGWD